MNKIKTIKDLRVFAKGFGLSIIVVKSPSKANLRNKYKYRIQGKNTKMYADTIDDAVYLINH